MIEQMIKLNVLKVGGSLGHGQGLQDLGREIGRLGAQHGLLIVPGGGEFADVVRDHYRRYHLDETTAHHMALLAMDQYGCLLSDLIPHSVLVTDLLLARREAASGRTPILLPSSLLIYADPLPHSWQITSDAIAAWIATLVHASRLILLKDVDGLFSTDPAQDNLARLHSKMPVQELVNHHGGIDDYVAIVLGATDVDTWVINGQHPERLTQLLQAGQTHGTHITHEPERSEQTEG